MPWFRRSRDHSPKKLVKLVEAALVDLGLNPEDCRNDEGPEDSYHVAWNFMNPSSGHDIFLILRAVQDDANEGESQQSQPLMVLEVRTLVVRMPTDNLLPFYRRLLEINSEELSIAAFGISGQYATISTDRPTTDLDAAELLDMISAVAHYAEKYSAELRDEFSAPAWDAE